MGNKKEIKHYSRRDFLSTVFCAGMAISIPQAASGSVMSLKKPVRIGIITDLHHDVMHDGLTRLKAYLNHMRKIKPDAIMQMGDFAYPGDKNKEVIDLFNKAHDMRLHVIGNHDTDAGYKKEQCLNYWGMPARYYTQMVNGICFIVLDGNDKGSPTHKGGYPSYINEEQLDWLKNKLNEVTAPVIIVSHQPLAGELAVDNALVIQELLSSHRDKILIAINGHTHINASLLINGINYVHFNSASYFWVGEKYIHDTYPLEIVKDHKWIAYTCPYKDSLFAAITIDPATLTIHIQGTASKWVGMSPAELHYDGMPSLKRDVEISPFISNRKFKRE